MCRGSDYDDRGRRTPLSLILFSPHAIFDSSSMGFRSDAHVILPTKRVDARTDYEGWYIFADIVSIYFGEAIQISEHGSNTRTRHRTVHGRECWQSLSRSGAESLSRTRNSNLCAGDRRDCLILEGQACRYRRSVEVDNESSYHLGSYIVIVEADKSKVPFRIFVSLYVSDQES